MKFKKLSDRVLDVYVNKGQWVLQISDVHYDSQYCDRNLLTKHLKEAEQRGAVVFINGDLMDLMQGKWDPRGGYSGLRAEYKHSDYLDRVCSDVAEYLLKFKVPYILALGNHETNIIKRMHTNPLSNVALLIRAGGGECVEMGYDGYIRWMIKEDRKSNNQCIQYFHHGSGGNAPRSKGILSADIDQMQAPDAQLITKGHDHNKWAMPVPVERVSTKGTISVVTTHHLRTGSYQKLPEYGWAKEKKFAQPPLGGYFVKLDYVIKRSEGRHRHLNLKIEEAS